MKRAWRARPARYGLLAFTLLVFTACLLFSFHRIRQQHELELRDIDVSLWMASRAEFELQRLLVALDRYALGRTDVDHEDVLRSSGAGCPCSPRARTAPRFDRSKAPPRCRR